jgi:hypothetical protein
MTFSGQLVSADYLQREAPPVCPTAAASARFATLRRDAGRVLGPALAPRAVAASVALPLARWLGWPAPCAERPSRDFCAFQLVAPGTEPVLMAATAAGGATRPLRSAVALALANGGRWLLVTDGRLLRVVDVLRGDPRGVLDIALDACNDDGIALGWLVALAGPAAFVTGGARSLAALAHESEAHGKRVCAALREGVGDALDTLTTAVAAAGGSRRGVDACYADARIAVYRVLFLLFAEARQLVPLWHPTYRRGYSVDTLGLRAASGASPRGTWAALQAIARLAHAGADAGDFRVVAFNGRLFSPARAPLLDHLTLDDHRVGRALTSLCFAPATRDGRQRIAYRDLGVEELGSVYESLLDRRPVTASSRGAVRAACSITSTRKTTGTFYTPRTLADAVVRQTLEPVVAGKSAEEILSLRVLDPAMGSGAFLVSAGRYLSERWEAAVVESGEVRAEELSDADRAAARRRIASRCLFGVDRNPMAVQLAQLSLWLATLAPDRPLSFLDHHLVCGNSLIGASPLDVLERPPGKATRSHALPLETLFDWSRSVVSVRDERTALERTADDTASAVHGKERTLAALADDPGLGRWKRACDLWCAAWTRSTPSSGIYHACLDHVLGRGPGTPSIDGTAEALIAGARALGCFHWPLEFPEVFLDADGRPSPDGGFDAVIGNPPWEMLRQDGDRNRDVREETTDTVRFARDSGTYRSQGRGHANQVQLFVERSVGLARPGGRIGLIVPATLLTDEGSAPLRRSIILANGLDTVCVYENRRAIFPIHRSVRFATLVVTRYGRTSSIGCRFGLTEAAPERHGSATTSVRLTPALLEHVSGPGLAVPDLPTPADVALVERITQLHRPLAHPDGWHVTFGRELNASDDRDLFRDRAVATGWPVIEGRHLAPFRVDLGGATRVADPETARARLGSRAAAITRPRLAYRDVASATNRTTLIAAIVPADVVTVHTVFCLRERLALAEQRVLCALMNSYVANYLVRRRVTTHVTTAIVSALPVPAVTRSSPLFAVLDEAARHLERASDAEVLAESQAVVAKLYELTIPEFDHILGTFPLVPPAERAAASARFRARTQPQSFR